MVLKTVARSSIFTNEEADRIICDLSEVTLELGLCLRFQDSASFFMDPADYCSRASY